MRFAMHGQIFRRCRGFTLARLPATGARTSWPRSWVPHDRAQLSRTIDLIIAPTERHGSAGAQDGELIGPSGVHCRHAALGTTLANRYWHRTLRSSRRRAVILGPTLRQPSPVRSVARAEITMSDSTLVGLGNAYLELLQQLWQKLRGWWTNCRPFSISGADHAACPRRGSSTCGAIHRHLPVDIFPAF